VPVKPTMGKANDIKKRFKKRKAAIEAIVGDPPLKWSPCAKWLNTGIAHGYRCEITEGQGFKLLWNEGEY